ncbi:MAG: ABC transporter permease [Rikenellaceae bacterium]
MKELINEILSSIRHNKLRTALTGFSVAWGIFLLMILLGSGNGLQNGVLENFGNVNINTININAGYTSLPYGGYEKGRKLRLFLEDADFLVKNLDNVVDYSATIYGSSTPVNRKENSVNGFTRGVTPNFSEIEDIEILEGRNFSSADMKSSRKVVIINQYTADLFFAKNESAIGQNLTIGGLNYKVVGIAKLKYSSDNVLLYVPITTFNTLYRTQAENGIGSLKLVVEGVYSLEENEALERKIKNLLADRLHFDKADRSGIYTYSSIEGYLEIQKIFLYIKLFLWIIGSGTLTIGIIGVSNIMIVTVKERTFEFGIRKSMGATPKSLVRLVLIEAVAITTVFGYIGLLLGSLAVGAVGDIVAMFMVDMPKNEMLGNIELFKDPYVDMTTAIIATVVLIIAGIIAGYIPARRASRLKTIDAMRYNK